MHPIAAFAALATVLASSLLVQAKTYYVDDSCTKRDQWKGAWDTAMRNAKRVSTRLGSDTDTDFERVVKILFKIDRSDDRYKKIKEPFDDILSWTEVPKQVTAFETLKPADVRIFCDNDAIRQTKDFSDVHGPARWNEMLKLPPKKLERYRDVKKYTFPSTVYLVPNANEYISSVILVGEKPWCQQNPLPDGGNFNGYASYGGIRAVEEPPMIGNRPNVQYGQKTHRVVITLCDYLFKEKIDFIDILNPQPLIQVEDNLDWDNMDYDRRDMEAFESLIAHTILHELLHAARPDIMKEDEEQPGNWVPDLRFPDGIGDYPDIKSAYNWHNLKGMDTDTAIKNADSYAELGLLAMLADKGYTLRRVPQIDPNDQNGNALREQAEEAAKDGYIGKYVDITKRALWMVARRFMA
ncbi:hypothetical protein K458DRAFT_483895 [Lentithecium fluviatile CBS 122367]|uniref:Lysine-specific metallo-endopeptidase domain-containing protein n=1 Tax=Lentithecium fluviatile CBS 122367 TaxID=1168545 RepID=A0A6G1JEY8_9PLEO|nr:hypothetical protein K458DRAFT_483895 [Lentithecium fluviatile CBS 122367]